MNNILVTGATGQLGAAVTENLVQKAGTAKISVLVRDAAKAEALKAKGVNVLTGNYTDQASLLSAFKGIDKVYLVSGNDIANRGQQQQNVINAAKEAGVKHIIYTSFQRKNETDSSPITFIAKSHLQTEELLKASGLIYTILQHTLYSDIIPLFAGERLLQNNTIYLPAGQGKTAYATRTDMAEAGANILLDETGRFNNQTIEITGPEAVSWQEIAGIISGITGHAIQYVSPSVTEFTDTLTAAKVPAEYVGLFAGFSQAISEGEFENVNTELETLLGRKPQSVAGYLKSVYGK